MLGETNIPLAQSFILLTILVLPIWETQTWISSPVFDLPPAGFNPISAIDSKHVKFVPCHAGIHYFSIFKDLYCSGKLFNLQIIFFAIITLS